MPDATAAKPLTAELNVTPMLDVLLVLLVLFMALVQGRKSLDAQLLEPCAGTCRSETGPIVLEVLPAHVFRLNRRPVQADRLYAELGQVYHGRPDKVLHVAGYPGALYQDVITAMDIARAAGVRVIGIPPRASYLAP